MSERFQLTKSRAKKLVKSWEGHLDAFPQLACSQIEGCVINNYFMELKRKMELESDKNG